MTKAGGEIRRRAKAAALVALAAELDALTRRMKRLPTIDPETFSRADAIYIVLCRGVEDLKKGSLSPSLAPFGHRVVCLSFLRTLYVARCEPRDSRG